MIYLLGKRLARPGVGVIAALLLALNWLHLEWSQEARPYIGLVLLTCLSFLAYHRFLESPAPGRIAQLAGANLLLVYTHHFGWLVVLAQAIDALVRRFGYRGTPATLEQVRRHPELAANLFRATQTEEKLRRENIQGKTKANKTHFEVGKKVRKTIEELGGTMPEDLPKPDEDLKKLEKKQTKKDKKPREIKGDCE